MFLMILNLEEEFLSNSWSVHGLRTDRTQHSLISANCDLVCIAEYRGISEKPTIIITILTHTY